MVGHTTFSMATMWVETDIPAEMKVHYWFDSGAQPVVRGTDAGKTDRETPHIGTGRLVAACAGTL
jgi:hypothetical protein